MLLNIRYRIVDGVLLCDTASVGNNIIIWTHSETIYISNKSEISVQIRDRYRQGYRMYLQLTEILKLFLGCDSRMPYYTYVYSQAILNTSQWD